MIKKVIISLLFLFTAGRLFSQDPLLEQWYQQALSLKQQQNCREAVVLFEKILNQNPSFKETIYELGWCYNELQQFGKALEVFRRKATVEASDYRFVYERAFSLAALGNAAEAVKDYDQVIRWQPAFAPAYSAKAELMKDQLKDVAAALQLFIKAADLDTGNAKNFYWAGWCCNELGQPLKAIPFLTKAAENLSYRALAFSETGFSYYSLGNYILALDFLTKSDNIRPKMELNLFYMGMCYVKQGNKPLAVKKYNELVLLESDYAISLLNEIKNMK